MEDELPQESAMGHRMYVVGMRPNQFFYCEKCGGYTGSRVQKLAAQCQHQRQISQQVMNLMNGLHPTNGMRLDTMPRRMTKRDTGHLTWCGTGAPDATYNAYVLEGSEAVHLSGDSADSPQSPPHIVTGNESF